MVAVKFERIISVTSEDAAYCANNLLSNDTFRRWTCAHAGQTSISVIIQLSEAVQISSIDIGNAGSAFVEVQAGTAADPDIFETVLPASTFMTANDSRNGSNLTRVRIFTQSDLCQAAFQHRWDRIKLICTQPFNKDAVYGLSFVKVYSLDNSPSKRTGNRFHMDQPSEFLNEPASVGPYTITDIQPFQPLFTATANNQKDSNRRQLEDTPNRLIHPHGDAKKHFKSNEMIIESDCLSSSDRMRTIGCFDQVIEAADESTSHKRCKLSNDEHSIDINAKQSRRSCNEEIQTSSDTSLLPPTQPPSATPLRDVIFALSGYQNPKRSEIRDKAVELGATYSPSLTTKCTHLICAFRNTPKFDEARKMDIVVVSDKWIDECKEKNRNVSSDSRNLLYSKRITDNEKTDRSGKSNNHHNS